MKFQMMLAPTNEIAIGRKINDLAVFSNLLLIFNSKGKIVFGYSKMTVYFICTSFNQ